ncbi:mRNA binding protein puf3 [Paramarasmius palmivorus]|uniref:mRNA binding protein puf3 n=1 Tax=Paramarasmius palmivorus TaxID=297713 RepID=A0AAW0DEZ8_9AGAR
MTKNNHHKKRLGSSVTVEATKSQSSLHTQNLPVVLGDQAQLSPTCEPHFWSGGYTRLRKMKGHAIPDPEVEKGDYPSQTCTSHGQYDSEEVATLKRRCPENPVEELQLRLQTDQPFNLWSAKNSVQSSSQSRGQSFRAPQALPPPPNALSVHEPQASIATRLPSPATYQDEYSMANNLFTPWPRGLPGIYPAAQFVPTFQSWGLPIPQERGHVFCGGGSWAPQAFQGQMGSILPVLVYPPSNPLPEHYQLFMYPWNHWPATVATDPSPDTRSPKLAAFHSRQSAEWLLQDIAGSIAEFSQDRYGCKLVQARIATASDVEVQIIMDELVSTGAALQLMFDFFGNYVIQKMFD